ncbi:MAG: ABC transporter permease, partial [Lachnospiraceae bacterium]|nr:ABC transporter permease [Lachnospiraceae bacterium]
MTSKSLFFKLMKEDLKRKIWAVGLAFLSFFFWMPVSAAMNISELLKKFDRWSAEGVTFGDGITAAIRFEEQLRDIVSETVGTANVMNATTIVVAAIVMALTGFMYLHSKKQMDFYHSVPVRREILFAVRYLNGILIVAVCYLINLMFACGVLMINGADTSLIIHE